VTDLSHGRPPFTFLLFLFGFLIPTFHDASISSPPNSVPFCRFPSLNPNNPLPRQFECSFFFSFAFLWTEFTGSQASFPLFFVARSHLEAFPRMVIQLGKIDFPSLPFKVSLDKLHILCAYYLCFFGAKSGFFFSTSRPPIFLPILFRPNFTDNPLISLEISEAQQIPPQTPELIPIRSFSFRISTVCISLPTGTLCCRSLVV